MTALLAAVCALLDLARRDRERRSAIYRALAEVVRPSDEALVARELSVFHDDEDGEGRWGWRVCEFEAWLASRRLQLLLTRTEGAIPPGSSSSRGALSVVATEPRGG